MALERERSRGQRDPCFYFIEFLVLVDSFSFLLASDIILVHRAQGCLVFLKRNCIFILLHFPFFSSPLKNTNPSAMNSFGPLFSFRGN